MLRVKLEGDINIPLKSESLVVVLACKCGFMTKDWTQTAEQTKWMLSARGERKVRADVQILISVTNVCKKTGVLYKHLFIVMEPRPKNACSGTRWRIKTDT